MRRAAFVTAVVLATALVVGALWAFRAAVLLLLLSLALAAALRPMIERLQREGWSPGLSIGAVYAAAVGAVAVLGYVLGGELIIEVPRASGELAAGYEQAAATWPDGTGLQRFLAARMPAPKALYGALRQVEGSGVARLAIGTTLAVVGMLGQLLVVVALSIYWSAARDAFERLWLSLLPVESRVRARQVWGETRVAAGAHFRREIGQSLIVAAGLSLGLSALGHTYWAIPALAVAVLRLVPLIGVGLATLAAALAGLADGPTAALLAGGLTLAMLVLLRVSIGARLFDAPRLNPILSVLIMLGLARHHGFTGLIVAPMLAAAVQTATAELLATHQAAGPRPDLAALEERLIALERGALLSPALPETQNLMARARRLLERVRET